MTIRVDWATIVREFQLLLTVTVDPPRSVTLRRVTDHPTNQEFTAIWGVDPIGSTRISLQLDAALRVPAYIPSRGIPDEIAEAFVGAAARALGGGRR